MHMLKFYKLKYLLLGAAVLGLQTKNYLCLCLGDCQLPSQ